ncbi:hypothetical protein [Burkholderia cepacia]|uniref:hypothetical protein n=1 Tax=Burkholderia cepacia TaxID=292 RepID=UPI0002D624F4|nr:hypothetical protein [Burkholderia cepacia]
MTSLNSQPSQHDRATQTAGRIVVPVLRLTAEPDVAQLKAETWRANAATLEARIDELTLGPVGARTPLFVTVGGNCKPQRHESLENAQRRGRALVRSEKESEVLVLEPVAGSCAVPSGCPDDPRKKCPDDSRETRRGERAMRSAWDEEMSNP